MTHQPQTIAYGVWCPVPCLYCGADVLATSDPNHAPYWLPLLRGWVHHRCYFDKGKGKPTEAQAALFTEELKEEA